MPAFAYKARTSRMELIEGVLESPDRHAAADQLYKSGLTPVDISPAMFGAGKGSMLLEDPIRPVDVEIFTRQMYSLVRAGVPILRALAGLEQSATNKRFAKIIRELRESLDSGRDLSSSMARHPKIFSNFYVSMVRIGELTGRLTEIFPRLAEHLEFDRTMRQQVASALRYPTFVMCGLLAAVVVINLFVIPAFAKTYSGFGAQLPIFTRILLGTSTFTVEYWPWLLGAGVAVGLIFKSWIGTPDGRYEWDRFKFKIPIAGKIMLKGTIARFARSFALSVRSGIPIAQALSVVGRTVDNVFVTSRIEQIRVGVERGESIARTASIAGIFTPVVIQMVAVGEETGELDKLMDEIADMYEQEVVYELKTLASQIEPIVISLLGIIVLILALGVFLPMWDLSRVATKR